MQYKHWSGFQECNVTSQNLHGKSPAIQFERRRACFQTVLMAENSLGITYAWITVVRPDLLYKSGLPNPLRLIGNGVHARLTAGNGLPVQGLYTDHFSAHFPRGLPCYIDCRQYYANAKKGKRGKYIFAQYNDFATYCPCGPEMASHVDCMVIEDCVALVQRESAPTYFSFQYSRLQDLTITAGIVKSSTSISCLSKYSSSEKALNLTSCSIDGCAEVELTKHLISNQVRIYPLRVVEQRFFRQFAKLGAPSDDLDFSHNFVSDTYRKSSLDECGHINKDLVNYSICVREYESIQICADAECARQVV
eukprot:4759822-Pyramimonas_sp.AAC.1